MQAGGRTGLTALTVAALIALSLFVWPLFVVILPQAIAPALVLVGILMLQGVARIDMTDLTDAVPVSMTLLVTVLSNNLIDGMAVAVRPTGTSGHRSSARAAAGPARSRNP